MTDHTPGPWSEGKAQGHHDRNIYGDGQIVAQTRDGSSTENKANARLIAAAPDMYEALKLAVEWAKGEHGTGLVGAKSMDEMKQAIAKAEGREQ